MNDKPTKPPIAPTPWRVAESVGGKVYIYDANNKVLFVPNMSATNKTKGELHKIYRTIVFCVNRVAHEQSQ